MNRGRPVSTQWSRQWCATRLPITSLPPHSSRSACRRPPKWDLFAPLFPGSLRTLVFCPRDVSRAVPPAPGGHREGTPHCGSRNAHTRRQVSDRLASRSTHQHSRAPLRGRLEAHAGPTALKNTRLCPGVSHPSTPCSGSPISAPAPPRRSTPLFCPHHQPYAQPIL
jgi:hypothetical protein